jgi:DNA-binding transcriptional MerR regulator
MRYLKTSEAARLLNVSTNTLRKWELSFGFPKPMRSPGQHRMYVHGEVVALREALQAGLSVASAVSRAREVLTADSESLIAAFGYYDRERADLAIEAALVSRSLERTVEEVLLPALEQIIREETVGSAAWAFAAPWGVDWLRRATRLAPPASRPLSIFLSDASRDQLDPDALHIRALELFCMRAGARVLSLSARGAAGIRDALATHGPDLVVLAGGHMPDDFAAGWTHSVRLVTGATPVALYRPADHLADIPTAGITLLPSRASHAQQRLFGLLETTRPTATIPISPVAQARA